MPSKIKNIILFTVIAAVLILAYVFLIKKGPEEKNLVSSKASFDQLPDTDTLNKNSSVAKDFLTVLLSVKSIKLDDSIFSDQSFANLQDSSIFLTPPGDEGRANPFAPIGFENSSKPVINVPPTTLLTNPEKTP